jgi:hypothetical protein
LRPSVQNRSLATTTESVRLGLRVEAEVTTREKLHLLVDQLSDAEAEAALTRLSNERELLRQWTATADPSAAEAQWALANAREAIREERW